MRERGNIMAEILRFVTIDHDDNEGETEYVTREQAIEQAAKSGYAVAMRTYILDDTELVWTPDGGAFWPPKFTANDRLGREELRA
jgi:hypothetical protein